VNSDSTIGVATQKQAFSYPQVGQGAAYAVIGIIVAAILAAGYHLLERTDRRDAS
jgi:ABC-type sugar transport system permease subunit